MKNRFSCNINDHGDCVIPLGVADNELKERNLPTNCLECEHYVMDLDDGSTVTYRNSGGEIFYTRARLCEVSV